MSELINSTELMTSGEAPKAPESCAACCLLPLTLRVDINGADCNAVAQQLRTGHRQFPARRIISRQGDAVSAVYMLFDGWAFRYKLLSDGRRQILCFLIPGDPISYSWLYVDRTQFSVQSLTAVTACVFEKAVLNDYIASRPVLMRQIGITCARAENAMEERLLDIGRRSAYERVGRLLLDLYERLRERRLNDNLTAYVPLSQTHLADALGLTAIHVGRVLRQLHDDGVLTLAGHCLKIHDFAALGKL